MNLSELIFVQSTLLVLTLLHTLLVAHEPRTNTIIVLVRLVLQEESVVVPKSL